MACIEPFRAYRYTQQAGSLERLATLPYDTIPPDLRAHYAALSPYNLVRLILSRPRPDDGAGCNAYTRARDRFRQWIAEGVLARDEEPCLYLYSQRFRFPDTGEWLERRGFIGLGAVEDYSQGVVHRHEKTLDQPKADRLNLLRAARARFGSIFMLYEDEAGAIEQWLFDAPGAGPELRFTDHEETVHSVRLMSDDSVIRGVCDAMRDKKLLIADGHHRYEASLAFQRENPSLPGARRTMMAFVNLHSPGLRTLAAHRLIHGLSGFTAADTIAALARRFRVAPCSDTDELRRSWASTPPETVRFGIALQGDPRLYTLELARPAGALNLTVLHDRILGGVLGITAEDIAREQHVRYRRGLTNAIQGAAAGEAQIAFLVEPLPLHQLAREAFSGNVLPQKSTDFFPKLASGVTIYSLDD